MRDYRPSLPFTTPMILLTPTDVKVSGVKKKTFPSLESALLNDSNKIYCSFKTYGGTERDVNGVYSIEDTAIIETWYRPDIKSNCRVARLSDEAIFEIINEPENINMRNQFLKFKIRRVKGGA